MKTISRIAMLTAVLFGLLFSANLSAEEKATTGSPVAVVNLKGDATVDQVTRACVDTALGRKWEIVSREEGKVVIHLKHRKHDSTLTMVAHPDRVEIYSESYRIDKEGRRLRREDPEGWIKYLVKDLPVRLSRILYE